MKKFVAVSILILCVTSACAQTAQQFCDSMAGNAQSMYRDANSQEYASGKVGYNDLLANYAGPNSQADFGVTLIQREILDAIVAKRGQVSAKDVNDYIFNRCENDYNQLKNRKGRYSGSLY